jgi:glycosyltransferase involved in cell wall biosynthesis
MAYGNGADIVHHGIGKHLNYYKVVNYNPYLTIVFPILKLVCKEGNKADLIHTTPDYAIFFGRKEIPKIISFHNYILDPGMRFYSSYLQWIHYRTDLRWWISLAVKKAARLTAVSKFTAETAKEDLHLSKTIQVIYNGIDEKRFFPAKNHPNKSSVVRILFSGNPTIRKGANWLPGIAEKLKTGIKIYYTRGLRKNRNIDSHRNLISMGMIPFENMPQKYREMDILLIPTVREGLSLAVLEAMACGLPVVASDCSSLPEQIDDGKGGFLCPVGDVDAFAEKLNILADTPSLRKEMGEYNRAKVEKMFTLDRMVSEYKRLFEEVMDQKRGER